MNTADIIDAARRLTSDLKHEGLVVGTRQRLTPIDQVVEDYLIDFHDRAFADGYNVCHQEAEADE